MRRDPFLDFHRTAEAAGYPALLVVSLFALGLVVTPVLLLALALLAGELGAAFADVDEAGTPPERPGAQSERPSLWDDEAAADRVAGQLDPVPHA
jgi:hypothetical protein